MMRRQLLPAIRIFLIVTVVCGLAYPLVMTGVAQGLFKDKANGSLVETDGKVVGSSLLGQAFGDPRYFASRPSAAGDGYDGAASGGSNLGPTNPELADAVAQRVAAYRRANGLSPETPVPVDAVTSSASGLDPMISVANADIQAARVASARGLSEDQVLQLVSQHTENRSLGVLGERGVNVLMLNLSLDQLAGGGS
jgi:K+-transporting ATPase ATPase C chain